VSAANAEAVRWLARLGCLSGLLFALLIAGASAAEVERMRVDGRATGYTDQFLTAGSLAMIRSSPPADVARLPEATNHHPVGVLTQLTRLRQQGQLKPTVYRKYVASFNAALAEVKMLPPARADELEAVVANIRSITGAGLLTGSRLPALFLTLDRNRKWWWRGPLLSYGQRVEFAGSQLVWEFYPGQGIELQVLGSFSKAQWMCAAGGRYAQRCRSILAELIPLAARRAGGLTWEYYFKFDGGVPPWTSAMSQGTALQALADAYRSLGDPAYLNVGESALAVFGRPPPVGVAVKAQHGTRYLQYSFAPARSQNVINGFLQSLIGLDDYAQMSHSRTANRLFAAGNTEAQAELPGFDTGAWSLYQPGEEDSLSYHVLVTGFLQQLCAMTRTPTYCSTAARFARDLKTPPALQIRTSRVAVNKSALIRFSVSKVSRVGITLQQGRQTVFSTSASFARGQHVFSVPPLRDRGTDVVKLDATDLAGNYAEVSHVLRVG
jgi:D-glucuronyl C5-epimerase C-terminus